MATNLGTAVGYLTLDITGFTRGIDDATRQMDRMGGAGGSTLDKIGTAATKAGTALTAAVTAPIVGFGASILREGTTFEEGMTQVKNVANLAASDINDFRAACNALGIQMADTGNDAEDMYKTMYDYAINQGSQTRYTAEEVAQALYYMGLAGWDASEMMQGLRPVLDLSAASGEDLARVSDIVTDSMTALGIPVQDLSSYTNVLAEMTRSSNTTLDQAGEAFKYVAPLAGALGYSMQDVAAAIGLFANVGVKGSQAGTGLRQAINSLTNPSEKAKEVLDRLNWSIYDTTGQAKPLNQVMNEMRQMFHSTDELDADAWEAFSGYLEEIGAAEEFDNSSVREQIQMMSEWASTAGVNGEQLVSQYQKVSDVIKLVGIRALPGMLGIINSQQEDFDKLVGSINSANEAYDGLGTANGMANELMSTTQGSIYKLTSSISELKIQLFDFLQGPFQGVVDKLTEAVAWFNSLDDATQKNAIRWAGVAAAVGPALLVFGKLVTGLSQLRTAFGLSSLSKDKFAKNVTGTLNPALGSGTTAAGKLAGSGGIGAISASMLAVIAVVAAFIAVFVHLWRTNEEFRNKIIEIWNSIVDKFNEATKKIVDAVNSLGFDFESLGEAIHAAWDWLCNFLAPIVTGVFSYIGDMIKGFIDITAGVIQVICGLIKGFKDGDWTLFVDGLGTLWNGFWAIATAPAKQVFDIVTGYLDKFGVTWDDVWTGIKDFFMGIWNGILSFTKSAYDLFIRIIDDACEIIFDIIRIVFTSIYETIESIWNAVVYLIKGAWELIKSIVVGTIEFLKIRISNWLNSIKDDFQTKWTAIKEFVSNIWNGIKEIVTNAFNFIKDFIKNALDIIKSIMQAAWSAIKDTIQNTLQTIQNIVQNVWNAIKNIIQTVLNAIQTFVQNTWNNIKSFIANTVESIKNTVSNTFTATKNAVITIFTTMATAIINKAKEIYNGIVNTFKGIKEKFESIGSDVVDGLWNGLKSGWEWLTGKVKKLCDKLIDGVKDALKIGSPSKVMADEVGRWLPPGISEGFEDAMPGAEDDINKSLDDMIDEVNARNTSIDIGTSYSNLQGVLSDAYSLFASAVETTEQRLSDSLDSMYEKMYSLILLEQQLSSGTINTGYGNPSLSAAGSQGGNNTTTNNNTGNTFIFNSPKAIDEVEAARQMEKTQREMEEGFI